MHMKTISMPLEEYELELSTARLQAEKQLRRNVMEFIQKGEFNYSHHETTEASFIAAQIEKYYTRKS